MYFEQQQLERIQLRNSKLLTVVRRSLENENNVEIQEGIVDTNH